MYFIKKAVLRVFKEQTPTKIMQHRRIKVISLQKEPTTKRCFAKLKSTKAAIDF